MKGPATAAACLALLTLSGAVAFGRTTTALPSATISIGGSVPRALTLKAADLAALPHQTVTVVDDDKSDATYDGVALEDVLENAGVMFGEALHGPRLLDYAIVSAADGYHVLFSLAEIDRAFAERNILIADRRNGEPLDAKRGPFRVIVPGEKRHARWIRSVTAITVERAAAP